MSYKLLLAYIAICSAQGALTTSKGCDPSCLICFTHDTEYCFQCKQNLFFNLSGNCIADGIAVNNSDCPKYSYKNPEDQKCYNCPFECASCQFNVELGAVECLTCEDDMGNIEQDNKPWQLGDGKTCFCVGILDKGDCLICDPTTEDYDEETVSCTKKSN